jgi:putative FmdB family regulatory protein
MPIFDYRCLSCSHAFEKLVRVSSSKKPVAKISCPQCGAARVRRLVSVVRVAAALGDGAAAGDDAAALPAEPKLFGRKELNEVTRRRKKAGLD